MDSLTQIVLGAAVGEATLGKKIGNRAMLWGALAGTIPDLDIIGNLFLDGADALAFHRGFSHSITFSVLGALLFAWLIYKLYQSENRKYYEMILACGFSLFIFIIVGAIGFVSGKTNGVIISLVSLVIAYYTFKFHQKIYIKEAQNIADVSLKQWRIFWFLTLFTHPLLDSLTSYGTQLFAPFSDYRVAVSNISVADPLYTTLFLLGLIAASYYHRSAHKRQYFVWTSIVLSSLYMLFTVYNKFKIEKILVDSLEQQEIPYQRYTTTPSILNNILWSATIETKDHYYQGFYSMLDTEKSFKLNKIDKNHELIVDAKSDDSTLKTLKWFSNNYYTFIIREDGNLQMNDMRYGTFMGEGTTENDYIFRFILEKNEDGYYSMLEEQGGPPEGSEEQMMSTLWNRIKGI